MAVNLDAPRPERAVVAKAAFKAGDVDASVVAHDTLAATEKHGGCVRGVANWTRPGGALVSSSPCVLA